MKVIIEMYTGASDEPREVRELSVGDTFDDLSDQWSWFKIAGFTSEDGESTASSGQSGSRGGPMTQITDPADRIADSEFVAALERRYGDLDILPLADPGYAGRYAAVCDLVVQLLWPEKYGTGPGDEYSHTSDRARTIARLIFTAAAIEPGEDRFGGGGGVPAATPGTTRGTNGR